MLPREPTPCLPNMVPKPEEEQELGLGLEGRWQPSSEAARASSLHPAEQHTQPLRQPHKRPGSMLGGFLLTPLEGGASIIPISCRRRQAHTEYVSHVTGSIVGQSQVPTLPVRTQSSMLVGLAGP